MTPLSQLEVTPIKQLVDVLFLTLPVQIAENQSVIMVKETIVVILLLLLHVLINALYMTWSFQALSFSYMVRNVPAAVGTNIRFGQIGVSLRNVQLIRELAQIVKLA